MSTHKAPRRLPLTKFTNMISTVATDEGTHFLISQEDDRLLLNRKQGAALAAWLRSRLRPRPPSKSSK